MKKKKFLSFLMALIVVITVMPLSAITVGATETSGICGDNLTWEFDYVTGVLTISGTGCLDAAQPWYELFDLITEVVICDGVMSMDPYAFCSCVSLKSISIGKDVATIGEYAFDGCVSLTSITVDSNNQYYSNDEFGVLFNKDKSTLVYYPQGKTETEYKIPNSVLTIDYHVFADASLTSVIIPESVTTIGFDAFYGCVSLTSITVDSNNQYYSNDEFGVLFNKDKSTLVYYPQGKTETEYKIPNSVLTIDYHAFYLSEIISVIIPESVTTIDNKSFYGCGIKSITIPESVTSIGRYAFGSCSNLVDVTIYGNGDAVIDEHAFYRCKNLTDVTIGNGVAKIGEYAFGYCDNLTNVTICGNGNTTIEDLAFEYCKNLTNVTIGNGVTTIEHMAFSDCTSLTDIIIPDSVKSITGSAFYKCSNLVSITVDESSQYYSTDEYGVLFNKDKTTLVCHPIGNLKTNDIIPDGVTTIGAYAFAYTDFTNIIIPNSVTTIQFRAFENCGNLTAVTVGNSVTTIGAGAFWVCNSLTSINLPESVTTIDEQALYYCDNLTDIYYCGTEEQFNTITLGWRSISKDKVKYHNYTFEEISASTCSQAGSVKYTCVYCNDKYTEEIAMLDHNYVDGTCTICGENKMIIETMTSQIRFNTTAEKAYTGTFDVRTRVMISDEDFKELVGETNAEAIENIDKIGFVYTINGEDFSAESAKEVAQGGTVAGYVDAPVKNIQDAEGYYMFTCLVTDIPETDNNYVLTAYAYICVNGKWYVSEAPMDADFEVLYDTYYPVAAEKYGWEA